MPRPSYPDWADAVRPLCAMMRAWSYVYRVFMTAYVFEVASQSGPPDGAMAAYLAFLQLMSIRLGRMPLSLRPNLSLSHQSPRTQKHGVIPVERSARARWGDRSRS